MALHELINDLEEYRYDTDAQVFLLSDLVKKYEKNLSAIFPPTLSAAPKTHATRLKDDILAEIPDLQPSELIHEDFLSRCEEIEAKTLCDALHKDIFSDENRFDGSLLDPNAQTTYVPSQLLSFIRGKQREWRREHPAVNTFGDSVDLLELCKKASKGEF